jgi:hypothetical protein
LNADWQGSNSNARIWNNSLVKAMIEWQRQYLLAGDSAYPISENLITSYWNAEALRQPMKACFNRTSLRSGLSALRTSLVSGSGGGLPLICSLQLQVRKENPLCN